MLDVFELIQQLCPDGVEYRRLGDIGVFQNGKGISKSDLLDNGDIPVVHYGQIYTTYTHAFRETVSFVDKRTAVSVKAHHGDVVVCLTDTADLGFVGKAVAQICGVDVGISGDAGVLHLNPTQVDARYLSYVMATECFQVQKEKCKRGTTVMHLNVPMWKKIRVPVPPLPVQEEIVRILDTFDTYCNDMTAGLAGELEMRRKQFHYWREKLIDQQHDYNAVLGHFFTQVSNKAGHGFPKEQLRVVSNTMGLVSKDDYEQRTQDASEDLCNYKLVGSGEFAYNPRRFDVGSVAYNKESDDVAVSPAYQVFSVNGIHPDYLTHLFRHSAFDRQREQYTEKGAGMKFTFDKFQYVSMPVPPMDIQLEIVAALNKFQELERELERELELRKKQFEYYRDRLLTFPEKVVN